jgi:hypothetical protein
LFLVKIKEKMDLEAAKTATVDSMEVAMEKQSDRFHAGRNNKKETYNKNRGIIQPPQQRKV